MLLNTELERLKLENNYSLARQVFDSLIAGECPDIRTLETLYGKDKSQIIAGNIKEFLSRDSEPRKITRPHNPDAPGEIQKARIEVEKNKHYQKIHSSLLLGEVPEEKFLYSFYGDYSMHVRQILAMYLELGLMRKCDLIAATHLSRVGAVVYQLKMNEKGSFKYSTIAVMHDAIEDVLKLSRDTASGQVDIDKYKIFIDQYIPLELQHSVLILTNHYNLLLNYISEKLEDEDKALTVKNIINELENIADEGTEELSPYAAKMADLMHHTVIENGIEDSVKWACYEQLYLNGILETIRDNNDHRIYEIKGVDLSDNAHGKGSLSSDAKIRNINKNMMWGVKGYSLGSTWKPFNDHIQEVIENSLLAAEEIVINDLLQPSSSQDFVMSAMIKIKKLENVFYV